MKGEGPRKPLGFDTECMQVQKLVWSRRGEGSVNLPQVLLSLLVCIDLHIVTQLAHPIRDVHPRFDGFFECRRLEVFSPGFEGSGEQQVGAVLEAGLNPSFLGGKEEKADDRQKGQIVGDSAINEFLRQARGGPDFPVQSRAKHARKSAACEKARDKGRVVRSAKRTE